MKIYSSPTKISSREVRTIQTDWICPKCDAGQMISTGEAYMTNPVKYFHVCNVCEYSASLSGGERFPKINYV